MDVFYFLSERTGFVRSFYDTAAEPFLERKRLIEGAEPPFVPPYSEDDEPPFLEEWIEADTSLEVIGRTCVSILSDSLKLYLATWDSLFRLRCGQRHKDAFKKAGFLTGYRMCFEEALGVPWEGASADLDLLEQVTHARNDAQHPDFLESMMVTHRGALRNSNRELFFANEHERRALLDGDVDASSLFRPKLHIDREALFRATSEVEKLAEWLEVKFLDALYPGRQGYER